MRTQQQTKPKVTLKEIFIRFYKSTCQYCGLDFQEDQLMIDEIEKQGALRIDLGKSVLSCYSCSEKRKFDTLPGKDFLVAQAIAIKNQHHISSFVKNHREKSTSVGKARKLAGLILKMFDAIELLRIVIHPVSQVKEEYEVVKQIKTQKMVTQNDVEILEEIFKNLTVFLRPKR